MPITLLSDVTDAPFVEVFIDEIDPAAATLTVYRLAGGREFEVRGAVRAATAGSFTRVDFEIPFNILVTYRAELFDAGGQSIGFTNSASITLHVSDTWMHNPLNPAGSVKVELLDAALRSLSRPVPGEVSYPSGRRVGVVLSEPRRGLAGAVFDVMCETQEEADKVQALIGTYQRSAVPVICIRSGAPMRVAMPLFLGVFDITEEDFNVRWGGDVTVQRIQGDEVDPPIPGLYISTLTRADINVSFATRAEVNAAFLTRADLNRAYTLSGAAG